MFFLYLILAIIILSFIITFFTSIEIKIKNLKYLGYEIKGNRLNKNSKVIIKLYLFEKLNYLTIKIDKDKIKNEKFKNNLNKIEQKMVNTKNKIDINILNTLKNVKLKIIKLDLSIDISIEDAAQNAILVGLLSTIISIISVKFIEKNSKIKWKVMPLYQNKNFFNVNVDCIFRTKLIHIIYTIINMNKKGEENDRTSNRRAYAHSHE